MCMSLVNQNKIVKSLPPLKVWNFAVYGHVHVLISMVCCISETQRRRANVVFVCISILSFFKLVFLFCFSKVSNLKAMLAFYHLSHKLNCVFV